MMPQAVVLAIGCVVAEVIDRTIPARIRGPVARTLARAASRLGWVWAGTIICAFEFER